MEEIIIFKEGDHVWTFKSHDIYYNIYQQIF